MMIGPGTCKLYYASGCEEAAWRVRAGPGAGNARDEDAGGETSERERLRERAEARARERRRWIMNFDQGLLFAG